MARISQLVSQSIRRNKRDFVFSSIGIVVGIGTLLFFTALGAGIKQVVLERVFVIGQLEVEKPSVGVGSLFGNDGPVLNDRVVDRLKKIDGVDGVYPKMKLTFPTSARGGAALIGKDIWAELIADGIPPELVSEEIEAEGVMQFKDWEAQPCDAGCPSGYECGTEGLCVGSACTTDDDCGERVYCTEEKVCEIPIPVLISPNLLEIYNGSVHTAMRGASGGMSKLPKLSAEGLIGLEFTGVFGKSYLGRSKKGKAVEKRMRLVGFSYKAMNLGATMPIGYVSRLNHRFRGEDASKEYHSILVDTVSNDRVAEVVEEIRKTGFVLSDKYESAQRAGLLILLMTLVFNLISLIILAIAAVNIMHTFLMIVLERRRELALMRAVGATRSDIRALVFAEATVLGLVGGAAGATLGYLMTLVVDAVFHRYVMDFPFKPDSLFVFQPWMFAAAIGVSVLFCLLGAAVPAVRASRIDPAAALSGN